MSIPVLDTTHIDAQSVIEKIEKYGPVKIKQSKKSIILAFFGCFISTTLGILCIIQGESMWASIFFFGLGVIFLSYAKFSMKSYILLSSEGFSISSLYQSSYKWTDVKGFGVDGRSVVFEISDSCKNQAILKKIQRSLNHVHYKGYIVYFPDEYNMSPKELADLLNTLREHFYVYSMWH
ncbi:MAG: STM3941 family protein [Candidatus Methanofastidiosia archaeon]|jgi:hypothetical protein